MAPTFTHIGGGAVLEGVMMRGRYSWAVAALGPSGRVHVEEHDLSPWQVASTGPLSWPLVRGCVSLASSIALSARAFSIASSYAYPDEVGSGTAAAAGALRRLLGVAGGLALGGSLFLVAPALASQLLVGPLSCHNGVTWSGVEALVRLAAFVCYVALICRMPEVSRTFGFHGAEHKTIHCFEHGEALSPNACRTYSRFHPRCGTSFVVMTIVVAALVNAIVPVGRLADALGLTGSGRLCLVVASRVALTPFVVGLSYELGVRWTAEHQASPIACAIAWPGLITQRLTTREPDDKMLWCAILALERVYARDLRERWALGHAQDRDDPSPGGEAHAC